MQGAQWVLEAVLVLLLAATLFHALRLERALGVLKRDRAVLEELVEGFNESTRQAESGIERLRHAADSAGRQMAKQIETAQRLRDDLTFLADRSDRLAERLESAVRAARMVTDSSVLPSAANPAPVPVPQPQPEPETVAHQPQTALAAVQTAGPEGESQPPFAQPGRARPAARLERSSMTMRLIRPRLLPLTMVTMSALLLVKTFLLVEAAAEEAAPPAKAEQATPASPAQPAVPGATPMTAPAPDTQAVTKPPEPPAISDAERAVLLDLRQRRETLEATSRALDLRQAELAAADRRLSERVQQLSALQARLESMESDREKHQSENWAGLVKIYENMKPRDAAAIFDALDMQVLLQVLDRMQERRAAPVLAAMQPERARLATQLLAEMRTRAITPPPADPKG